MSDRYCVRVVGSALCSDSGRRYLKKLGEGTCAKPFSLTRAEAYKAAACWMETEDSVVTVCRLKPKPKRKHWLAGHWIHRDALASFKVNSDNYIAVFRACPKHGEPFIQLNDKGEIP